MKYGKKLLFFLCFSILSIALTAQNSTTEYDYTVHVGAFFKPKMGDFNRIQSLGYMYAEAAEQNLTRIYLGRYPTETVAYKTLGQVKNSGYPDAFVTRKKINPDAETYSIHLGTESLNSSINWSDYNRAGKLYALTNGNQIDIYAGQYDTPDEANRILAATRKIGLVNAQVKSINPGYLRTVTEFEAGIPIKNIVLAPVEQIIQVQEVLTERGPAEVKRGPNLMVVKTTNTNNINTAPPATAPTTYDNVVSERIVVQPEVETKIATPPARIPAESSNDILTDKSVALPKIKSSTVAIPNIRAQAKRTSVLKLQTLLKEENFYKNSLDGYYGKGTAQGWHALLTQNAKFRKYLTYNDCNIVLESKGGTDPEVDNRKNADALFDWEELNLLRQITSELCAEEPTDTALKMAAAKRAELLLSPQKLTDEQRTEVLIWNQEFWDGVATWSEKAAILKKWSLPLKASYLQSQIRLEDYFMDKGSAPQEATGQAIFVLKTMVEPYLKNL